MFDAIFGRSVKILKILAKVQCVLAFVLASMLCGAVHEMLKPINQFSAIVLGLVVAAVFWVLQMFLAWALYAFAELVEHTEATHKELSNMSAGLARYTKATYEELHSMNKGLEAYTKAMGKTMNSMNKNLYLVAKHCCAEEERARAAARPQSGMPVLPVGPVCAGKDHGLFCRRGSRSVGRFADDISRTRCG